MSVRTLKTSLDTAINNDPGGAYRQMTVTYISCCAFAILLGVITLVCSDR